MKMQIDLPKSVAEISVKNSWGAGAQDLPRFNVIVISKETIKYSTW
jgi:hypothetical protein